MGYTCHILSHVPERFEKLGPCGSTGLAGCHSPKQESARTRQQHSSRGATDLGLPCMEDLPWTGPTMGNAGEHTYIYIYIYYTYRYIYIYTYKCELNDTHRHLLYVGFLLGQLFFVKRVPMHLSKTSQNSGPPRMPSQVSLSPRQCWFSSSPHICCTSV